MNPYQPSAVPSTVVLDESPPARVSAFFGALALPGLGHFMAGYPRRGAIWAIVEVSFEALGVCALFARTTVQASAILLGAAIVTRFAASMDAARCGKRPRWEFGKPWSRSAGVLAAFLLRGVLYTAIALGLRATAIESYVVSSNSMMPALIGQSVWGTCTACGKQTPISATYLTHGLTPVIDDGIPTGICSYCGVETDGCAFPNPPYTLRAKDRILANKELTPTRWDIIAYRHPEDGRTVYTHRLVGLPGERIEIREGEVTVNGEAIEKPAHLKYLHYLSDMGFGRPCWGAEENAVTLGPDEYFVLGDFSARSKDSRLWISGAPGHPPYAVPRDHIIGVVTHIYWPPERWRVFERAERY